MVRRTVGPGARVLALAALVTVPGCGDDEPSLFQDVTADPSFPGVPGDEAEFAGLFAYTPLSGCTPAVSRRLEARTELRVFRGRGVSDADVRWFLGGLQRYFDHYGVRMFTRHRAIDVPLTHALTFDVDAIEAWVRRNTDVDPSREPRTPAEEERLLQAVGQAILYNTRAFVRAYGQPRRDVVNVLLLPDMVGGRVDPQLGPLAQALVGLGLSPELLAAVASDDPARLFYQWLGTGEFTPVAIVGVGRVRRVLREPDIVIAHEVGHAYGLVHRDETDNLMNQGTLDCRLSLNAAQLDRVEQATRRVAHAPAPSTGTDARAAEIVRQVRAALRARRAR